MDGCYTPSAGTIYPTLQLLEDQGYVRGVEAGGKKIYEVTPEGQKYLEEHKDLLDEIVDRVRETVRDFTGGAIGELQGEFARLARTPSATPGGAGPTIRRSSGSGDPETGGGRGRARVAGSAGSSSTRGDVCRSDSSGLVIPLMFFLLMGGRGGRRWNRGRAGTSGGRVAELRRVVEEQRG